jgi:hypothetical protein
MFDFNEYPAFNDDRAAVYHELGHALIWYVAGGAVGPITFHRSTDGLLEPSIRLAARDRNEPLEETWRKSPNELAERFLAGEAAARCYLHMPRGMICAKGLRLFNGADLQTALIGQSNNREDIVKVLFLANERAEPDWQHWVRQRLLATNLAIEMHWSAIEATARVILPQLPKARGTALRIPGLQVIRAFRSYGVRSAIVPAVEVLYGGLKGGVTLRAHRWWMKRVTHTLNYWIDPGAPAA